MKRIAHGCFTWDGSERRSNRYGTFVLAHSTFSEESVTTVYHDFLRLNTLDGLKVKITAKVVSARKSGHIGDMALGISPSTPEVGQEFVLGVGILEVGVCPWNGTLPTIGIQPNDGRQEFWMDPRTLYQLHDQTVDIFIEETTEDFSPAPDLTKPAPGVIFADGHIQAVGVSPEEACEIATRSAVVNHGDGLFEFRGPPPPGTKVSLN